MDYPTIKFRYNHGEKYTVVEIAKRVRLLSKHLMLAEVMAIARDLKEGREWEPEYAMISTWDGIGMLQMETKQPPNPYLAQIQRWKDQRELLEAGAAGDVQAAIRYCQMELNNEISHGAMG
jgi:hypothetical protein